MCGKLEPSPNEHPETIQILGARVHNLQNLDLEIPRNQLVVITGPSGSGKSSLAFDTLYAEGQRQYIESLSIYARQFLHQLERPDVDLIEGLPPTIAIDQRPGSRNPRSTVATVTELYDYFRLLFARLGEPTCHRCGESITQQSPEQIQETLLALAEGTRMMILAPFVRGRKGQHQDTLASIRKAGFQRARIDGQVVDLDEPPKLARNQTHHIEAVIDRLIVREKVANRLAESIQLAVRHGDGLVLATHEEKSKDRDTLLWHDLLFSTQYACPNCGLSFEELEPRTFSFNSPYGACPACEGLGVRVRFDPDLVIPNPSLSLDEGAIAPWKRAVPNAGKKQNQRFDAFLAESGIRRDKPIEKLTPTQRQQLIEGDGREFPGVIALLENQHQNTKSDAIRGRLESFRAKVVCPECGGARLRPEARAVRLAATALHEITAMTVRETRDFFALLEFDEADRPISDPITQEIATRLEFLDKVGLDYLTLDRSADSLSGGEWQRVRLATGLGSGLLGVCYILDEPTIGLHPRDNRRLIDALRNLQGRGNSVLVVEHDEAIMREADWLIDLGPAAGKQGGQIVAQGVLQDIVQNPRSQTGRYLSGMSEIPVPESRRRTTKTRSVTIEGVTTNNLKNVTARFPLSALVCVTGVSGSGKSSLLNETFARAVVRRLGGIGPKPGPHASLRGTKRVDQLIEIDQSPIGRTPRSNPATYTGAFDEIRKIFASTRDAKRLGFKLGRFSFNVKGGRCETCQGHGRQKIAMNFLPDLHVTCPDCEGRRFNPQTLDILYRDHSIADILEMRIDDAVDFFENFPILTRLMRSLQEVGLGYLTLGQSSTTLSGGEAQRIKLATELGRVSTGSTLYLLDEPTTGLHFDDVRKLLDVLNRLVDLGNTVIIIEHHLDIIKTADWILDLGPEGGQEGGQIIATGTPEQIATLPTNHTGRHLRPLLE